MATLWFFFSAPSLIIRGLLWLYQRLFSPDHSFWAKAVFPHGYCRYYPSCSEYGRQMIKARGVVLGGVFTVWRVLRCNPWSKGGVDLSRWFFCFYGSNYSDSRGASFVAERGDWRNGGRRTKGKINRATGRGGGERGFDQSFVPAFWCSQRERTDCERRAGKNKVGRDWRLTGRGVKLTTVVFFSKKSSASRGFWYLVLGLVMVFVIMMKFFFAGDDSK